MKTVHIDASTGYDVLIGRGLLDSAGEKCVSLFGKCRAIIVADDTVASLYLKRVLRSFENAGMPAFGFVFPAGEESKNKDTLFEILESAAENGLCRNDIMVALGGGIAGDLAGLAAALWQRGIKLVQLPTTLLAAVDSSVGGKTAVDLENGKNLAGVFHQPSLVICDVEVFATLPGDVFACGMAEVIKYGVLFDRELFEEAGNGISDIESTVEKCVILKGKCVAEDEFDFGSRRLLNFGHTFAHSIEKKSGYKIAHGEAVAVGMVMAAELSAKMNICDPSLADEIREVLIKNGLPVSCGLTFEEIRSGMINDKKRNGDEIAFILPERIGKCVIRNIKSSEI